MPCGTPDCSCKGDRRPLPPPKWGFQLFDNFPSVCDFLRGLTEEQAISAKVVVCLPGTMPSPMYGTNQTFVVLYQET